MPLRLRIAILYGALTGVVVVLACLYSFAIYSRARYDELDTTIQRGAQHVAAELAAAPTPGAREETLAAAGLLGFGVGVYDANGELLQQSGHSAASPTLDARSVMTGGREVSYPAIAALAPSVHSSSPDPGAYKVLSEPGAQRWRVYVLPIVRGTQYLAVALPLGQTDRATASFGRAIALIATLASVVTFLVGWGLASSALRPVAILTASAIAQSRAFSRRVGLGGERGERDELGRLATTLDEMLAGLEAAYRAQQRFVAAASHELRTPLTVVQANLELLLQGEHRMSDVERILAVSEAYGEATRMSRLVADLLVLARADAGVSLQRKAVDLDRVLLDVMGEVRLLARGQRLEVGAFETVVVQGDRDRLKQLILILIDNATRYTAPGGTVTVSLQRAGGIVQIGVRDTGIGIATEEMSHVFERFYRSEQARSRDAGGTGLGLSIARWIAEEHGGTVELGSIPGEGTTATVRLPVSR